MINFLLKKLYVFFLLFGFISPKVRGKVTGFLLKAMEKLHLQERVTLYKHYRTICLIDETTDWEQLKPQIDAFQSLSDKAKYAHSALSAYWLSNRFADVLLALDYWCQITGAQIQGEKRAARTVFSYLRTESSAGSKSRLQWAKYQMKMNSTNPDEVIASATAIAPYLSYRQARIARGILQWLDKQQSTPAHGKTLPGKRMIFGPTHHITFNEPFEKSIGIDDKAYKRIVADAENLKDLD